MLHNVLRKMSRLDNSATLDEVDNLLNGQRLTARDFTTVLSSLKKRQAWSVTLRVGEWLRQRSGRASEDGAASLPNRAHYQVMLSACAASGAADEAVQLRERMETEGVPVDGTVLSTLIFAHERARQPGRAVELLYELEGKLAPEKVATSAMELAPSADMDESSADDAASTAPANPLPAAAPSAELPPPEGAVHATDPLAFSYAAAIRAHEAAGDWEVALELFERLEARGVRADAHCYCAALGACRRGGLADRAVEILSSVRSKGEVQPNSVMYTLAMAACSAGKQWETSLRLFDEHKEVVGVRGEPYCYSVAMGACAQGRQWERALALLEEMEGEADCGGNAFAWNRAMVACNRAAQPNKTLELYDRIRSGACKLSDHSVAAALVACKYLTDKQASWQRAQAIFDGHKEIAAASPMCQDALLDALADAYQWELVLSYFDTWKRTTKPSPKCYERAIEACDRFDPDRSMRLFTEMRLEYASGAAAS